jgi:hypothetical protein
MAIPLRVLWNRHSGLSIAREGCASDSNETLLEAVDEWQRTTSEGRQHARIVRRQTATVQGVAELRPTLSPRWRDLLGQVRALARDAAEPGWYLRDYDTWDSPRLSAELARLQTLAPVGQREGVFFRAPTRCPASGTYVWRCAMMPYIGPITSAIAEAERVEDRIFNRPPRNHTGLPETIDTRKVRETMKGAQSHVNPTRRRSNAGTGV